MGKRLIKLFTFFILAFSFITSEVHALSFTKPKVVEKIEVDEEILNQKKEYIKSSKITDFYSSWRGTRYCYGGTTKKGVDCSALMQHLYKEQFDVELPRTTLTQVQIGEQVVGNRENWKVGDLIFFKMNSRIKHVGVYIGNNKFVHAGRTTGVTISEYDSYWAKRFWQTRRVI